MDFLAQWDRDLDAKGGRGRLIDCAIGAKRLKRLQRGVSGTR